MEPRIEVYHFSKKKHAKEFYKWFKSINNYTIFVDKKKILCYSSDNQHLYYKCLAEAFNQGIKYTMNELCQTIMGKCVNEVLNGSDEVINESLQELIEN